MKKILCVVICMLMCATVYTVTATKNTDASPYISTGIQSPIPTRDPWDLLYSYNIGATGTTAANGNAGAEFDGTYLYSTRWAANLIHKHNANGTLAGSFTIPGVSGLRDIAYDGTQYMYGGAAGGTIWKMDFTAGTLIQTLTGSFASRAIAYDYDANVIYCSNWNDPAYKVDPTTGTVLGTITMGSALASRYGLAYDPDPDGPFLWVFCQTTGATSTVYQWNLTANAYTGFSYNIGNDVGSGAGIAGGLWASPDFAEDVFVLGGCVQDSSAPGVTDWLFGYELYSTGASNDPPATPAAPTGPSTGNTGVSYEFTASTTDPDGNNISYKFDWGDGNYSAWLGPVASGTPKTQAYTWNTAGLYNVKVKAKDEFNAESNWSAAKTINITGLPPPAIEVQTITGGLLKVKAKIKNSGTGVATNVSWKIELTGGLILLGKSSTGKIPTISAGGTADITSKLILGFGKTVVKVTADTATKSVNATVLLVFIKI